MFSRMIEEHLEAILAVTLFALLVIMGGLGAHFIDGLGV